MSKTLAISAGIVIGILVIALFIIVATVLAANSNAQTNDGKTVVVTGRPGTHFSGAIFSDSGRKDIDDVISESPASYPVKGNGPVGASINRDRGEKGALTVKLYDGNDIQDVASASGQQAPVAVYYNAS